MRWLTLACSLLAVAALQMNASATQIQNLATGDMLFYTDYEHPTEAPTPNPAYVSGQYNDYAGIGTWGLFSQYPPGGGITSAGPGPFENWGVGTVQVCNGTTPPDPVAYQGSNKMRNWWDPVHAAGDLPAVCSSIQSNPGDVIKVSTMVYLPSDTDDLARMQFIMTGSNAGTQAAFGESASLCLRQSRLGSAMGRWHDPRSTAHSGWQRRLDHHRLRHDRPLSNGHLAALGHGIRGRR